MSQFSAVEVVRETNFDLNKMIKIMECIGSMWNFGEEYRVPVQQEILKTIQLLIDHIEESEDFIQGNVEIPIIAYTDGIEVTLIMTYSKAFKNNMVDDNYHLIGSALEYNWRIRYIPIDSKRMLC